MPPGGSGHALPAGTDYSLPVLPELRLTFTPKTDDVRRSLVFDIIEEFLEKGIQVNACVPLDLPFS